MSLTIEITFPTTQPLATTNPSTEAINTMETLTTQNSAPATDFPNTTQILATTQPTTVASDTTQPDYTQSTMNIATTTSTIQGEPGASHKN